MKDEFVYGINPVMEALRGKRRAFELFIVAHEKERRVEKIVTLAAERGVPVRRRERDDLVRLCGTQHHQGVALRMEAFAYTDLDEIVTIWRKSSEPGLLLVLDSIQDPHNLGALVRSAACAGAHGVVIPRDRAAGVTATVEKASAGAVETIPVAQVTNLVQALQRLKDEGFWIYGTSDEASDSIYSQRMTGNIAIVIGSEGEGVRPLVRKSCDAMVSIPLKGGVNSLNASVAGGIVLFEIVRQRMQVSGTS